MIRQILIVHNIEANSSSIHRSINANLNDVAVFTAKTVALAVETVKMFNINLILYSPKTSAENLLDVYHKIQPLAMGQPIPMLLLTAGEAPERYLDVIEAGVAGCLAENSAAAELCATIDQVCCPKRLREAKRYSIPRTRIQLSQADCELSGRVVNISEGGLLCQFDDPIGFNWTIPSAMKLFFALPDGVEILPDVSGLPVNVNVMRSHADYSPAQVRVAFRFIEISPVVRRQLGEIFADFDMEQQLLSLVS